MVHPGVTRSGREDAPPDGVHHPICEWHLDQYPWECTCGLTAPKASWHDRMAADWEAQYTYTPTE